MDLKYHRDFIISNFGIRVSCEVVQELAQHLFC